jgi:ATP synthase protein I
VAVAEPENTSRPENDARSEKTTRKAPQRLGDKVDEKLTRKLAARRERRNAVWFGLGMFGLIGWSIAIPTLLGIALGVWIDRHYPSRFSWLLMLMVGGLILGCLNAWYWLKREGDL